MAPPADDPSPSPLPSASPASLGHSAAASHGRAALPPLPPLRLLLLDNFDSYTHNLAHACAALCGTRPLVRFNTMAAADLRALLRDQRVDCVLVSPGPGRPDEPKDFGVCAHLYRDEEFKHVPVLGVCLGLQGQFSTAGGRIIAASEPMHGRLSAIAHDDRGLFAGLPQGFRVVRYNSLVADASHVPAGLEVSAWATVEGTSGADAVREVMGLRDIIPPVTAAGALPRPPRESVQFHPESICTEQGQQLLHNWFRMVVEHKRALASAGHPVEWCEAETDATDDDGDDGANGVAAATRDERAASRFTLQCRRLPFFVDSEQAFQLLHGDGVSEVAGIGASAASSSSSRASAFWLDSSKVEQGRSRFSYMGDNAGPLSYNLVYSVRDPLAYHVTQAHGADQCVVQRVPLDRSERIWQELEQRVDERNCSVHMLNDDGSDADAGTPISAPLPFNFEAGLVGYIGYAMRQMCTPDSLPPIHMHFDPPTAAAAASPSSSPPPSTAVSPAAAAAAASAAGASASDSEPSSSSSDFRVPDLAFMFADRVLVFDHQERHCYLMCLCEKDAASAASVAAGRAWMAHTEMRLRALSDAAAPAAVSPVPAVASVVAAASSLSPSPSTAAITSQSHWFQSESEYLHAIRQCLQAIRDGESYEVCLTNQLDMAVQVTVPSSPSASCGSSGGVRGSIRPFDYYRTLRRINPAAYAAFFRFRYDHFSASGSVSGSGSGAAGVESSRPVDAATDSWSVCCSSPERFLQVDRARGAESKPIKGTLPRGSSPGEDEALKRRLAASTKDFAENLMIVDLLRNDLGRVCALGTVAVPKLMEVESYATVHNLVSTVRGRLARGRSTFHLLQAAFPPGSMTGAPKLRTCQILAVLEKEPGAEGPQEQSADGAAAMGASMPPSSSLSASVRRRPAAHRERGIYSGCIGYIGINGAMSDLNVVIRTAIVQEKVRVIAPAVPPAAAAALAVPASSDGSAAPVPSAPSTIVYSTHFRIGAGGAIVYLSDPAEEYAEVHLKTKALVNAITVATREMEARFAEAERAHTPSA